MFTLVLKTAAKISLFSLRYHYPRFFLIFFYALRFHLGHSICPAVPQADHCICGDGHRDGLERNLMRGVLD